MAPIGNEPEPPDPAWSARRLILRYSDELDEPLRSTARLYLGSGKSLRQISTELDRPVDAVRHDVGEIQRLVRDLIANPCRAR